MHFVARRTTSLIVAAVALLTMVGAIDAGTFTGKIFDLNGTQITTETIGINVYKGDGTLAVSTFVTNGAFTLMVDGTGLPAGDKRVTFEFVRGGVKTKMGPLHGALSTSQTFHPIVPKQ